MSSLSPEAYAVIEGRHSDPFRYLGPHVEGDVPLVRIFLPDAEGVAIVDEQGHLCRQLLQVNRRRHRRRKKIRDRPRTPARRILCDQHRRTVAYSVPN
jgi:hypothetical protein